MSYDISFKVKVAGINKYIIVGDCRANVTWNVRDMIVKSTGLSWNNGSNNGLCIDIIPAIRKGYWELTTYPEKYKQYESPNGWGTIEWTREFFMEIIESWQKYIKWEDEEIVNVTTFWIE